MEREGRLKFIEYMQVIGIILVVAYHSVYMYPDGKHGDTIFILKLLGTLRMPMFMFVSGFLMVLSTRLTSEPKHKPHKFIAGKMKRLLVPFVTLTLVTFVPRTLMSGMADDTISMTWENLLMSLVSADRMVIPYLWFLQASFVLLTVGYTMIYLLRKGGIPARAATLIFLSITLIPIFLPFGLPHTLSLSMVGHLGVFFALGAVYCAFSANVDKAVPWTSPLVMITAGGLWIASYFLIDNYVITGIPAIAMCISLTRIMEARHWGILNHLGGANYLIFLLSWYLNVATQQILGHFVSLPWWIHTTLSLVAGIYIPWLGYRYLRSHPTSLWARTARCLLGQK